MEMTDFKKEFVERTRELICDQAFVNYQYDVTLLLNCMLALVSLPIENTDTHDATFQQACVQKLKAMGVVQIDPRDNGKLFRSVKNALSHMHIEIVNSDQIIDRIYLRDQSRNAIRYHTELCFSVEQLREYALFVAELHIKRC